MITAKYILENEAGERFDLTAPANIFLVNVEGLGITTNVTYGDLENGFFHTLYEQTPQNNITGDLVYQNAAYGNYQTLVNWIIRAKALYFCYQPLETEYRRIVKLNYIVKERRTAGGWMKAGISFAPLTPWYLAQPTEIGMGGIEEELSKGYFQDGEASPTIEPVQDLHGYEHPWPGGGGKNLLVPRLPSFTTAGITMTNNGDGSFTFSGKATSGVNFRIDQKTSSGSSNLRNYTAPFTISMRSADNVGTLFLGGYRNDVWTTISCPVNSSAAQTQNLDRAFAYIRFNSGDEVNATYYPQVETGPSATEWTPYSNICHIYPGLTLVRDDESTLVIYGGTLDAATGTLTATRAGVDMGGLTWRLGSSRESLFYAAISGKQPGRANYALSCYPVKEIAPSQLEDFESSGGVSNAEINIADPRFADATSFKAAMVGQVAVYELATPVTYQLTAAELNRALDALGGSYGYRYTEDLRYGGDAAGTMSATIAPSGHVPAAVVLRYSGAITNPRVRLVGAETGIVYGICAINTSLNPGQTFELSTRYEDSHVILIDGDGTETSLLGYVNQAYETYFRCPTTESAVLTIESDNAFSGEATLLVYTYFGSV